MTETPQPPNQQPDVPPSQPVPPAEPALVVETNKDARTWGMLCHLLALTGYFTAIGLIIGPLIAWMVKKDEYSFVDDQGKESLNFQIWMFIFAAISVPLIPVFCLGVLLLMAIGIADLILVIIASMKANQGIAYRYPLVPYRFLK